MLTAIFFWFSLFTWAQEGSTVAPPIVAEAIAPVYAGVKAPKPLKVEDVANLVEFRTNQNSLSEDPHRSKTFSKSFSLNRNEKVSIANVYGSIIVKTWDKSEVKLEADIKAYANNDSEAQKLVDNVTINATKNGNDVKKQIIRIKI